MVVIANVYNFSYLHQILKSLIKKMMFIANLFPKFPIQMQLSEKRKTFSQLFVGFLELASNLEHFQEKDDRHS